MKGGRAALALALLGCGAGERRFPLRDPMLRDADLRPVYAKCHAQPTRKDPKHVSCAPRVYDSPLYWDGADNIFFRPLSEALGVVVGHESVDVNSLDEVPDSSWFTNRVGVRDVSASELRMFACTQNQILDPANAADGSWLIDHGKTSGSTPGFRVSIPGKGKYMIKLEDDLVPERQVAASVIGEAVYWAAGYNASCEQALWVKPSIFTLAPGLRGRDGNFGDEFPLTRAALDRMLARSTHRGELVRVSASAWLPGFAIGEFGYRGTREDDPNDVVPHEDRRELRGARLLAAWIDHFDAREGNSFDAWFTDVKGGAPDSSPGHVLHYQFDTSDALGSRWDSESVSRRLGRSYLVDYGDVALDFITLGAPMRVWDGIRLIPGHEMFGYMNVESFDPAGWKSEYPNPAFSRMTERDGAWMARILARFTPAMIDELANMGAFTSESSEKYLAGVLEGRLEKLLARYLTRLSPLTNVRVEGDAVCAVDLAEKRGVRSASQFRYAARVIRGAPLAVTKRAPAEVCVALHHGPQAYVRIAITDGVATAPLVVHLYDLGPNAGFRLAGLERPPP